MDRTPAGKAICPARLVLDKAYPWRTGLLFVVRSSLVAVAVAALFLLSAPHASAQTHSCGSTQLVFLNPDLQPQGDGYIHAQGQFFAQFQAIGADATKIKVFGFSFSPVGQETGQEACGAPVWVTGAYIQNYRADYDPTDGFFIPVVTPLVPDGTYNAAVHAYDENNNELARFWGLAIVDNCDGDLGAKCDTDAAQMQKHDKTEPWMMVLPGDGKALDGHKLTLEFGEDINRYTVYLNGRNITSEMTEWDGRLWDADYVPDYAPGAGQLPHCGPAPAPAMNCMKYGPAYEWTTRALVDADVVRVEAWDRAGNYALKAIHVGSGITGGAISGDLPALEDTVDHLEQTAAPGKSAVFGFDIQNRGAGTGHPFADAKMPTQWSCPVKDGVNPCYEWQPVHVVVGPGEKKHQELLVNVPANTEHGIYTINATLTYAKGGDTVVLAQRLTVLVGEGGGVGGNGTAGPNGDKASFTLPGPVILSVLLGAAFALRRRERRVGQLDAP